MLQFAWVEKNYCTKISMKMGCLKIVLETTVLDKKILQLVQTLLGVLEGPVGVKIKTLTQPHQKKL